MASRDQEVQHSEVGKGNWAPRSGLSGASKGVFQTCAVCEMITLAGVLKSKVECIFSFLVVLSKRSCRMIMRSHL